jgi:DNA-directed RNA polymerase subunit RPC12/RpoP
MNSINHFCTECESQFTIKFDKELCADNPIYCPFCATYILDADEADNEDDE